MVTEKQVKEKWMKERKVFEITTERRNPINVIASNFRDAMFLAQVDELDLKSIRLLMDPEVSEVVYVDEYLSGDRLLIYLIEMVDSKSKVPSSRLVFIIARSLNEVDKAAKSVMRKNDHITSITITSKIDFYR